MLHKCFHFSGAERQIPIIVTNSISVEIARLMQKGCKNRPRNTLDWAAFVIHSNYMNASDMPLPPD